MLREEYTANCHALLAKIERYLNDPKAQNVAVLVRKVEKSKYYLDFDLLSKTMALAPDKKRKEKIEIISVQKLKERLLEAIE